ncbi:MAG TPA: UDP-N-acetylmuramoyl-tripeptide--D-alanyl-D-alanine ligase, partial [Candidatus Cryosericum sp.]|nr:UDP-N-acetylmuramoyl-tripeptide--D-alanyl-D-alanine ligase [Candidatus Cryosericum sp.]
RMEDACQAAVLEMGMSYRGEIARLVEIADPDVGVILNVLRVHLEHFGGLDGIAEAKGELFAGLRKDAIAAYNADDPRVARLGRAFPGRSIPFGLKPKGREVTAEAIAPLGLAGTRFILKHGKETTPVEIGLAGRHHVYNALAAAAAGYACGLDGEAIAAGLRSVRPAPMRGVLHHRPDGVEILDDAYNSNPVAMERAIDLLKEARPRGRRILASGDMLELGPYASRAHARLGQQVARAGIDLLVAVGPLSRKTADAARQGGGEAIHFESSEAAAAWIEDAVRPGDLVLVKGSRGMKMERVVQALLGSASGAAGAH